ncbi:MAG: hypothetical protein ABI874_09900, partial [Chloroflexota bacterium]
MARTTISAQVDKTLLAEAQRLVDAGEFRTVGEVVEEALQEYLANFAVTLPPITLSLEARVVQGLLADLDALEREQLEEFVTAYGGVTQRAITDDELVSLLELFKAYSFKRVLSAMHEAQASKVPLSPRYLETILEKSAPPVVEREAVAPSRPRLGTDDPLLAAVAHMYEQEIGPLTEKIGQQLIALVAEHPDLERWHEAFDAAASMNKKNLRYVIGCLRNNGA